MSYILRRHHPKHWAGKAKKQQTFLDRSMSVQDVEEVIASVLKQNRSTLMSRGTQGIYQITGQVDGVTYRVGINYGHVGQLYPLP